MTKKYKYTRREPLPTWFKWIMVLVGVYCAIALFGISRIDAAVICVDDDGSGDGSAWNNSLADIPATLTRGDTVYVADGDYGGHTFNTAASGTAKISILKATATAHGPATGWDDSLGDGQAVFDSTITFSTDHWIWDGKSRAGLTSGHGFKIDVSSYLTETSAIILDEVGTGNASYITILYTEVFGEWGTNASRPLDAYLSDDGPDSLYFAYNYVHEFSKGLYWNGVDHTIFEHNMIANIASDTLGSHGGAMPLYYNAVHSLLIRYNHFKNIEGSGCIVSGLNGGTADSLFVYGNLFYYASGYTLRDTGLSDVFWVANGTSNIRFYNNTIVNIDGLNSAVELYPNGATDSYAYNNVWYDCVQSTFSHWTYHGYNRWYATNSAFGSSISADSLEFASLTGEPFVDWTNSDFRPSIIALTDSGRTLPADWDTLNVYGKSFNGIIGALTADSTETEGGAPRIINVVTSGLADSLLTVTEGDSGTIVNVINLTDEKTISVTTKNLSIRFSGEAGSSVFDGSTKVSSFTAITGGESFSVSFTPATDNDDGYTDASKTLWYAHNSDARPMLIVRGNTDAYEEMYGTYTTSSISANANIDSAKWKLTSYNAVYGDIPTRIFGQNGTISEISSLATYLAAHADSTEAYIDYNLSTAGAAPLQKTVPVTTLVQEMVNDAGYSGKMRLFMDVVGYRGEAWVQLDSSDTLRTNADSLLTLYVYGSNPGEADPTKVYKTMTEPGMVFINGVRATVASDTADVESGVPAYVDGKLYVAVADTDSVYVSTALAIDTGEYTGLSISGAGVLRFSGYESLTNGGTLTRVIASDILSVTGADSMYRVTAAHVDTFNFDHTNNALVSQADVADTTGTGTDAIITDSALEGDFTLAGQTAYAADGEPYGAVYYAEAAEPTTTPTVNTNSWGNDTNSWADKPSWGTAW